MVGASREAADDLVRCMVAGAGASFGIHRASLAQLAVLVAARELARLGATPLSLLGAEALAARVTFEALGDQALGYFEPVARFPGFARALASTLGELRLAGIAPAALGALPARARGPGHDVQVLLSRFEDALRTRGLADRPGLFALAAAALAGDAPVPLAGLPTVLLDVAVTSPSERMLVGALARRAPAVLATVPAGDERTLRALLELGGRHDPGVPARPWQAGRPGDASALDHLRTYLFSDVAPAIPAVPGEVAFFSAPGEGREAVEIARRVMEEARARTPFDRMAILLRAPRVYSSLIETALARAGIPAFFARGTRRPDPSGRAFLALLDCALEKLSARRFAEYLSLGQVPAVDAGGSPPAGRRVWMAPDEETLGLGTGGTVDTDDAEPRLEETPPDRAIRPDGAKPHPDDAVPRLAGSTSPPDAALTSHSEEFPPPAVPHASETPPDGTAPPSPDSAARPRAAATPLRGTAAIPGEGPVVEGTLRAPWKWEQLLVDSAVIGGRERWRRRLAGLVAELHVKAEELRAEEPDSPRAAGIDRDLANLGHLERFALPLIDRLAGWPARATWEEWIAELEALAPMALSRPERALAVLAELRVLGPIGPVALDEVRDVLADELSSLAERPPAARSGRVFVGTLEDARGRDFDVIFVPGLAERLLPQKPREDPILLDDLRQQLGAALSTQHERAHHERLLLRLAAGAATRRLHLSYSRIELAEARPRVPSFYAMEVQRALAGSIPDPQTLEREAEDAGGAHLAWPAPDDPARAIDPVEHDLASLGTLLRHGGAEARGRARYLLELNDRLARSLRSRWARWQPRFTPYDGIVRVSEGSRDLLLASRLSARAYSVSALQRFAVCPYQFYLSAICRLAPRQEIAPLERLDPLTRGRLFHAVQAECLRALQTGERLPLSPAALPAALTILDETLARVSAEYHEALAPAVERVWLDEIESLRVDLYTWLERGVEEQAEWEPFAFELAFGLPGGPGLDDRSIREEVVLPGGFRLRGIVDLVERRREAADLRVTDHKTGLNRTARSLVVGRGEQLQPVLYGLAVERIFGEPVVESRLSFCTRAGEFSERVVVLKEAARRRGLEVLEVVDRAIARGFLPPAPRAKACEMCDFLPVCGPGEERRIAGKDPRALADLATLRSWP